MERLSIGNKRPLRSVRAAWRLGGHVVQQTLAIIVLGAGDQAGGGEVRTGRLITRLKYGVT